MTIYDQTGKIVEKKFYHSEWKLTDLLKARNDGLITDEGEAWKYRYSHMDGTGGKYDLLFRREPAAIEAPAQEPVAWAVRWADGGITYLTSTKEVKLRSDQRLEPLYTTPPDHLALVAAAYRDAAEQCSTRYDQCERSNSGQCQLKLCAMDKIILDRTPADAEAHLTALLRAEYERGKAEEQQERDIVEYVLQDYKHNRLTPRVVDIAYSAFMLGRSGKNKDDGGPCDWFTDTRPMVMGQIAKIRAALALLTQEGR